MQAAVNQWSTSNVRGVDIRCEYALSNVLKGFDIELALAKRFDARSEAFELGASDRAVGVNEPPMQFADVPSLKTSWLDGWTGAAPLI